VFLIRVFSHLFFDLIFSRDRHAVTQHDVFTVSMGCFLLASKTEERLLTLKEVIYTYHSLYFETRKIYPKTELEIGSELYLQWKNVLISIERVILSSLGFLLYEGGIDHPHQYLLYIIKLIHGTQELAQVAWNYCNDSMKLNLEIRYNSAYIACAAIFLASREISFPLPEGYNRPELITTTPEEENQSLEMKERKEKDKNTAVIPKEERFVAWWELLNIQKDDLMEIANDIKSLYEIHQVSF
jgi:hypothetical protein